MHITELHRVAISELNALARARYMPRGWDREANRTAERRGFELRKLLDALLETTPDRLMPYPARARIEEILRVAAEKRLLSEMVAEMVALLAAEPFMDQENAHASAEMADRLAMAGRLFDEAQNALKAFDLEADNAKLLEIDLQPTRTALTDLADSLKGKIRALEDNRAALTATS
jgi:hypothetical protein